MFHQHSLPWLLLSLCAATAAPVRAQAQAAPSCEEHKLFGDELRFECAVENRPGEKPARFVALFSGGHDDTMASLTLQADGVAARCGPGSKHELMGEDGHVSLLCHLPADGVAEGRHVYTLQVKWSHAEYVGFRLER